MTFRSPTNKQPRRKPAVNAAATVTLVPGAVFVPLRPRLPRAAGLQLTVSQQLVCDRILNVFEPDRVQGDCANISRFHDGPGKIRQITHGAKQTTKYGNLRELVAMYVAAGGIHSAELAPYVAKIGATALVEDQTFMSLLPDSGRNEPVMRATQDLFFDKRYFQAARAWANSHGFTMALSMLVAFDSFIRSGQIRQDIRAKFPERVPSDGGNERTWITQYVAARQEWHANHSNPEPHPTVYRTQFLTREIDRDNWDLTQLQIKAHGTNSDDHPIGAHAIALHSIGFDAITSDDVVWGDDRAVGLAANGAIRGGCGEACAGTSAQANDR